MQRSIAIKASPEKIYPLIADFNNWDVWSPFEKMDPANETHVQRRGERRRRDL